MRPAFIRGPSLVFCRSFRRYGELTTFANCPTPKLFFCPVSRLVKFVLLMPATNFVFERSACGLGIVEMFLLSTMTQPCFKNVMVIHIQKNLTTSNNHLQAFNIIISK